MKLSISNIALTAYEHGSELPQLSSLGLTGLEIAPSRVWRDTWRGLHASDVAAYRRALEEAGLVAIGLHSLFYDHPELGLFRDDETRRQTLQFLVHLSAVCRDLGGRTLIWGGGRRRGDVDRETATREAINFMGDLCGKIEGHGTCFCFEPLGPADTDFINSALESLAIVEAVDHPALAIQLDAKALVENNEAVPETFEKTQGRLVHFHANEPRLGTLGSSGDIDHAALGDMLRAVRYDGFVSIEQRQLGDAPMEPIEQSATVLRRCYGD